MPQATNPPSMWAICVCGHGKIHHTPEGRCRYGMTCPCVKFEAAEEP